MYACAHVDDRAGRVPGGANVRAGGVSVQVRGRAGVVLARVQGRVGVLRSCVDCRGVVVPPRCHRREVGAALGWVEGRAGVVLERGGPLRFLWGCLELVSWSSSAPAPRFRDMLGGGDICLMSWNLSEQSTLDWLGMTTFFEKSFSSPIRRKHWPLSLAAPAARSANS